MRKERQPLILAAAGGAIDMEYCAGGHFSGHTGNYMGLFQKREFSSDSKEQDISVVSGGHIRRHADQYPVDDYDFLR